MIKDIHTMQQHTADSPKILCADDEINNLNILESMLTPKGYEVITAADGIEALSYIDKHKVDLVLLDIVMPEMDGFEVCRRIKSEKNLINIPVIMITGLTSRKDRIKGIEAGAEEFLSKPFDKTEVLARIKMLLKVKDLHDQLSQARENLEQQVKTRTQELQKAYEELQASQKKLLHQEKLATIGHLAAGIVHEIKNPTSYIGGNLKILGDYLEKIVDFVGLQDRFLRELPPEKSAEVQLARQDLDIDFLMEDLPEMIAESIEGVEKIKEIVSGLKSFAHKKQDASQLADINQCLDNACKVAWNEIKYKAVVEKDYGEIPEIDCYPNQLVQIFINLLVNGVHAIEGQGTISITTRKEEGYITVMISDTGCGIPEANQEKIFEPFFTTKGEGEGTGLGLGIVRDIISGHQGWIELESEINKGTTFKLGLPSQIK
ncbi:MAG: response regulator [Thermodesulfobacteriota bacterium]